MSASKGIFWFTCTFTDNACDYTNTCLIHLNIPCDTDGNVTDSSVIFNSSNNDSVTHKESWQALVAADKELRTKPWNYFPRGRVDIRKGKALIFMNPNILDCDNYIDIITDAFGIAGLKVEVKADNSSHYACYADGIIATA